MSDRGIEIRLRINFPVIFFAVMTLHALFLGVKSFEYLTASHSDSEAISEKENPPLRLHDIRSIRTVGKKNGTSKNMAALLDQPKPEMRKGMPDAPKMAESQKKATIAPKAPDAPKKPLSLADLQDPKAGEPAVNAKKVERPGTRPQVAKTAMEKIKTLQGVSLKGGSEMQKFAAAESAAALSGDPRAKSLQNTDVLVNLEVPEGVDPDELNQYELMFYGFQRRTAIGYINTFYKHLDKFQRENPHKNFPLTETKQTMTGRITYDEKGNVKQIKMIRWSNVSELEGFFEDVLKDMDTLHNPPQALWERNKEFSIFFTLVING